MKNIIRRAAIFAALTTATPALPMGWYPNACCNEKDCRPVPIENVQLIDGQYVVSWGGQTIAFDKANPSPDGQFHICTSTGSREGALITLKRSWPAYQDTTMPTSEACFWAPGGM